MSLFDTGLSSLAVTVSRRPAHPRSRLPPGVTETFAENWPGRERGICYPFRRIWQ